MKVYVAGAMRGQVDGNREAFDDAKERWQAVGHQAFSPSCLSRALGLDPGKVIDRPGLEHVMQLDLACVQAADAIALLPGWEKSKGVTVELALAQFLGLMVFDAVTMEKIHAKECPWSRLVPSALLSSGGG